MLRHDEFQDPLHYYQWLQDVYLPQVAKTATKGIESMEGLGSSQARADILAVGGSIEETMELVTAKAKANADSPEALAAMQRQLAEMMAAVSSAMDSAASATEETPAE
jgi:hypothetical protein